MYKNRTFSHDVTAAILMYQKDEMATMFVSSKSILFVLSSLPNTILFQQSFMAVGP